MVKIIGNVKGKLRFKLLKQHRLTVFEKTFDAYLSGKVPAEKVAIRRKKLKELNRKGKAS